MSNLVDELLSGPIILTWAIALTLVEEARSYIRAQVDDVGHLVLLDEAHFRLHFAG